MKLATPPRPTLPALLLAAVLAACGDSGTEPAIPTTITLSPNTVSFTAVGQTQQLAAAITDQRGDPVEATGATWQSSDEAVATVSPSGLVTATGPGIAQVTAAVGEIAAVAQVSVTQDLASFEAVSGTAQAAPAGEPLPQPLVVQASDGLGNPIVGLEVTFAVIEGGGTVDPAVTTTGLDGRASTTFTLGASVGTGHRVDATVGGTSQVVTFTATATTDPASLDIVAGSGQSAPAGSPVPARPAVRVLDEVGQPLPGITVQFTVTEGGGTLTGALVTTGSDGIATVGSWTLGTAGVNTVTATVAGLGGSTALFVATVRAPAFDIEIRHQGSPTSAQLLAFARAEVRWEEIIAGDLPDAQVNAAAGSCGPDSPAFSEAIDDLVILVNLNPIDGPGAVLGAAGPCFIRVPGALPVLGQMRFDSDDLEVLEANDLLGDVILHEMGHVLGIGTLWGQLNLLADASLSGGTDPHFTGPQAIAAFDASGGADYTGQKVPVEDTGDQGTADSHWRESVFGTELMTGFIGFGANPLSSVTVQSLRDLGFTVNAQAADGYTVDPSLRGDGIAASVVGGLKLHDDIIEGPIYAIDPSGTVVEVIER